jgi:hypothetical protein
MQIFCGAARAGDWATEDTARQAASTALLVVDWKQTRYMAQHPERYREVDSRWVLGDHPSTARVDGYFAASAVMLGLGAWVLPPAWRRPMQYLFIGCEYQVISHNRSIGIRVPF